MKIAKLILDNFKGIKSFALDLGGKNATICGDNAVGKTTLYDAFLWLLFGKDSQGRKDFAIKPTNAPAGAEVAVACDFTLADGSTVSLKKVLKENWVKQKGKLDAIYSGDVTACYIDGVPKKVTEFNAYIKDICDETVFKLLTNPLFFNEQMKWQDRRAMLFEVCGNVSDADVIASNKELQELPELMGKHTVEDFKKILAERKKSISKELGPLLARINETAKTIVEVDVIAAKCKIAELEPVINQLDAELHRIQSGEELKSLKTSLMTEKESLLNLQTQNNRYRGEQEYAVKRVCQEKFDQLDAKRRKAEYGHNDLENEIFRFKQHLQTLNTQLESACGEYASVKSKAWSGSSICPTCQQKLPQDQINASIKRFNDDQSEKMKSLKGTGKSLKAEIKALTEEIDRFAKQSTEHSAERDRLAAEIAALEKPVIAIKDMENFAEQSAEIQDRIATIQQEFDAKSASANADIDLLTGRIAALRIQLSDAVKITLLDQQNRNAQARIDEYEQQQKDYAKQWEETEKAIFLCEQFVRQKTPTVTDRVNAKFKLARFKLFDQQLNGGIAECCETMVDGVTYSNLNNAMRINVGLDIIATLQKHFNFAPPVFIDNAESITDLYKLDSQMIRLVVSEPDKKLRVEVEE